MSALGGAAAGEAVMCMTHSTAMVGSHWGLQQLLRLWRGARERLVIAGKL